MTVTLRMSGVVLWLLRVVATAAGIALGFLAKPVTQWLVGVLDGAPGPLRAAAALPTAVAVPGLAAVGLAVGLWLSHTALKESLQLTVGTRHVRLSQNGAERHVPRDRVAEVFLDGKELVFLDADTKQLARNKADDLGKRRVSAALEQFGYPWFDAGDPHEADFQRWTDGHPTLDDSAHAVLRARARALGDKQLGRAADLADQLQDAGLVVRDRDGGQQYRRVRAG